MGLIDTLPRLSAAANNRESEPTFPSLTAGFQDGDGSAVWPVGGASYGLDGASRNGRSADPLGMVHALVNALFSPDDEPGRARFADLLARHPRQLQCTGS